MENKGLRFDSLNGLRVFAAIGIIMMHVQENGKYIVAGTKIEEGIISFTQLVYLFMVISGFSMCCGYYEKFMNGTIKLENFYSKRYRKIWPFFAIMCLFDFILNPSIDAICEVFANLTLFLGFLNTEITVIGVGWFLGVVFIFYLIFPFLCYLISNKRRAWLSFIIAILLNLVAQYYFCVKRANFAYCAVYFIAGGMLYLYKEKLVSLSKMYRWGIMTLCILATGLYYIIKLPTIYLIIVFSLYIVYAMDNNRCLLNNKITDFLSNISMEVYLCHMAIYRVLEKMNVLYLFGQNAISYGCICVATFVGAVIFSSVVNTMIAKISYIVSQRKCG